MMMIQRRSRQDIGAMLACVAALFYAFAPLLHSLVHPDHAIVAALSADAAEHGSNHHPGSLHHDDDCALFQLYAGHGGHAIAATNAAFDWTLLPASFAHRSGSALLPAGAPRGIALGRGPPRFA